MAKLIQETISITISRMIRDDVDASEAIVTPEMEATLETVVAELVGNNAMIEVSVDE